ncbi:Lysosomal pro-X carboxypeptidase-like protein [Quillaja saponaria]|uniref:Lysosomal pro-X carboxypeptidase-like protein n=1 Tax=Quillaja saponaria TaxID=32244 RepID=A0AAD7Q7C3_QUISA|nr:Lysosomal pro-X carboxypeptidase-like protein [Quillaja saponaria]
MSNFNFYIYKQFTILYLYFFSLLSNFTTSSFPNTFNTPKFPSSIIRPDQISVSTQNGVYRTKFFTQILDHFNFNPKSYQTFQQRYLIRDTYWGGAKNKAPVYTGNERKIE